MSFLHCDAFHCVHACIIIKIIVVFVFFSCMNNIHIAAHWLCLSSADPRCNQAIIAAKNASWPIYVCPSAYFIKTPFIQQTQASQTFFFFLFSEQYRKIIVRLWVIHNDNSSPFFAPLFYKYIIVIQTFRFVQYDGIIFYTNSLQMKIIGPGIWTVLFFIFVLVWR